MNKTRIYELAKEFNTTSKELIKKIEHLNIKAHNHMSALEPEEVEKIRNYFEIGRKEIRTDAKKPAAAPAQAAQPKAAANTGNQRPTDQLIHSSKANQETTNRRMLLTVVQDQETHRNQILQSQT
jgi:translation initiation factor IF-2